MSRAIKRPPSIPEHQQPCSPFRAQYTQSGHSTHSMVYMHVKPQSSVKVLKLCMRCCAGPCVPGPNRVLRPGCQQGCGVLTHGC